MERQLIKDLKGMASELNGLEKDLISRGEAPEISLKSLPRLNNILWGLRKGLTVVAARTSQGKSAFALQIALDLAKQNIGTLVLSLEMDVTAMLERLFCNEMQIDNYELLSGRYNLEATYQDKFTEFKTLMNACPLLLACGIGKTFHECNKILEMLDPMPKVIILDYIQMSKTTQNDRIEIGEYIRQFRQLMIQKEIRGIICSQINRQVEKESDYRPRLENLKGCIHPDSVVDGRKIRDIVNGGIIYPISSYDVKYDEPTLATPSKLVHSGKRHCIKVKTKSGKEVIVSVGTKLYDGMVWREAKTYQVGQKILVDFSRSK